MQLVRALRLHTPAPRIAFTGAGGKTTALFQLARELSPTVLVTATTHLGAWQVNAADHHLIPKDLEYPGELPDEGVILVTDEFENDRTKPISPRVLNWLRDQSQNEQLALLIEADGSRQKPLKAPAAHEPPIPDFVDMVVVCAGLSGLGQPLDEKHIHRAEIFAGLSGLPSPAIITPVALTRVLSHPAGGLKNIPSHALRVALLNQADTPELQAIGGKIAHDLLRVYDAVLVGSLREKQLQTIERCAGIILAAGESKRYGSSKQLLDWHGKPFIRHVTETALSADLDPVLVIAGADIAEIESALAGLPVKIIHNPDYQQGQSTSIKKGIQYLLDSEVSRLRDENPTSGDVGHFTGSAIFLLADQPQIPAAVIRALRATHTRELPAILAPLVMEEKRANPVLFDRVTFPDLLQLTGDVGGRAIFAKHRVEYLPWYDESLLLDVDTPEDYEKLWSRSAH